MTMAAAPGRVPKRAGMAPTRAGTVPSKAETVPSKAGTASKTAQMVPKRVVVASSQAATATVSTGCLAAAAAAAGAASFAGSAARTSLACWLVLRFKVQKSTHIPVGVRTEVLRHLTTLASVLRALRAVTWRATCVSVGMHLLQLDS